MNRTSLQSRGSEQPEAAARDPDALIAWIQAWPDTRQLAQSSRRAYRHEVRRLVTWCEHKGVKSPCDLDCDAMRDFFSDLASEKPSAMVRIGSHVPLSPGSITQARRIVNMLVRDAVSDGLLAPNLLRLTRSSLVSHDAKGGSKRRKRLSNDALGALLFQPIPSPTAELAISLAFWCGVSISEMARLRWRHLRSAGSSMFLRIAPPSSPTRLLAVPGRLARLIQEMRTVDMPRPAHFLFSSAIDAARPVTPRTIARWIKKAAHSQGARDLDSASSLRRAFVVAAREHRWKESEILFRVRRWRVSEPRLRQEQGASASNLLALEATLRSAQSR